MKSRPSIIIKNGLVFFRLLLLALILVLAPTAFASTTWYLNGTSGSDSNHCLSAQAACKTIGHAISLAASGDSIMVYGAQYLETLVIGISLNIVGCASCANPTVIEHIGGGPRNITPPIVTISSAAAHVSLSNLTITGGFGGHGGGVYNQGTLTINFVTIIGNIVYGQSCGGGGIANYGTLTINKSTITNNSARGIIEQVNTYAFGGGIFNSGTLTINNSTLSGNGAGGYYAGGGGIVNSGTLMINNSTLSGNHAGGAVLCCWRWNRQFRWHGDGQQQHP